MSNKALILFLSAVVAVFATAVFTGYSLRPSRHPGYRNVLPKRRGMAAPVITRCPD